MAVQADGKILVGGNFTKSDGKILLGGDFLFIGGQSRSRIARVGPTTGLPDSFNPGANNRIVSIRVQADSKVLAGGVSPTSADRDLTTSPGSIPRPLWPIRSTQMRMMRFFRFD